MHAITISDELRAAAPQLTLGCITATVHVQPHSEELWRQLMDRAATIKNSQTAETLTQHPAIAALRLAYRRLGKDPTRYRSSAEALARRAISDKGLYRVNTVIDINNLVSLETLHSVGTYDTSRLQQSITFRVGKAGETYPGIGKGVINIEGLPVFADQSGPFGSPTSDSDRTKVTERTSSVLMCIIAFSGGAGLAESMERVTKLLVEYAGAQEIEANTVS